MGFLGGIKESDVPPIFYEDGDRANVHGLSN
jgi:hypothetical protein